MQDPASSNGHRPVAIVSIGAARLPKALVGGGEDILVMELCLDAPAGRIVGVGASLPLPGYVSLLRALLVGRQLHDIDEVVRCLPERIQGPLLRPTIAALLCAAAPANEALPR